MGQPEGWTPNGGGGVNNFTGPFASVYVSGAGPWRRVLARRAGGALFFGFGGGISPTGFPRLTDGILPAARPRAGLSAVRARSVSCRPFDNTSERGLHNRRSPDAADSIRAACVARSARRLERQLLRSRGSHPRGWSKQHKDRLGPVRTVSSAARRLVNALINDTLKGGHRTEAKL